MGGCTIQTCIIWVAVLVLIASCCWCSYGWYAELPPDQGLAIMEFCGIVITGLIMLLGGLVIWKRSPWDEGGWE
jgi:hypothetical protein